METAQPATMTSRWRTWAVRLVLFGAVVGAGAWVWKQYLEDRLIPKRWGVVESGKIYRSGQLSAALVGEMLETHEIAVVVDLTAGQPGTPDQKEEAEQAEALGIERVLLPLGGDGTGDIRNYATAIARVHQAEQEGKPVLVHCAAGAQRTGGVIAAYRMLVQKKSPEFACREMERYDWDSEDDRALPDYVNRHMAELAQLLVDRKVIDHVPDPLPVLECR